MIGDKKSKAKIRKTDIRHVLPQLKVDELCSISLKMKSCFDKEGFKNVTHARFFEKLKVSIMCAFYYATKAIE